MCSKCIVDCHMHALTKEEFNLYMKTACADKYINIRGLYIDEMLDPYNFEEFIDKCIKAFNLINFDNIIIHYFNKFGKKYIIKNEGDFQKSLKNKISKYYVDIDISFSIDTNRNS